MTIPLISMVVKLNRMCTNGYHLDRMFQIIAGVKNHRDRSQWMGCRKADRD